MLPTDATERKNIPVYSGFICYFPDAIAEVAKLSKEGNDQHNPGSPLHWDRSKSGDERDALMRHVLDGVHIHETDLEARILEARAVAWRSMADLQKLCEKRAENSNSKKIAPGSWISPGIEAKRDYIKSLQDVDGSLR